MAITVTQTRLPGVLLIEPHVFYDERGFFFESFNRRDCAAATGMALDWAWEQSFGASRGWMGGLFVAADPARGWLIRVALGAVFVVAVDVGKEAPQGDRWVGELLTEENKRQLWIPPGFAHGFQVISPQAEWIGKSTHPDQPDGERLLDWNDPAIGIQWPLSRESIQESAPVYHSSQRLCPHSP
ncbi:MAG: dTDP-4-dehydrorhamnose 3,5-epimerase family protein [Magnetococcales bacterium]|nr:dTDP-4-dehydrorhamnose 3,5-epimerase family protein [Magnetococcales bacterium]